MVDNVEADIGSGGAVFATDEISNVHYPINKLAFGALDIAVLASFNAGNVDNGTQRVVIASDQPSIIVNNGGTFAVQVDGINGTIDANNSTETLLGIGATFTGASTNILQVASVTISVFSDVASATDGLMIQFSKDNINWDHDDVFTIPAGVGKTYSFQPQAEFMRVLYTNGVTGQAEFRMSVRLATATSKPSSHRIADSISDQDDVEIVKAVITGENPGGTFTNVQTTTPGNLKVSLEESNGDLTGPGTEASALRVTMATDSTGLLSVDDNGGSLTVDIGAAATAAGDLAKAEDDAHGSGDVGVMALAVRNDALGALADTDGDYASLQVDADGALYTRSPNKISDANSTTSTLGISGVFTGAGEDVSKYSTVTITIDASHNSATNGMSFEFSSDNVNWDDMYLFTYTAADGARRFQFPVTAQYFRLVYTNGTTGQTHFRVQTIFHVSAGLTTIHRLSDAVDPDRSATLVKSVIIAQAAGSGDFTSVQATASGNLKMSVEEISDGLDIGAGNAGSETQRMSISTDDVNLSAIKTAVEAAIVATTDSISAALQTNQIMDGTTSLTPKYAAISAAASPNNTLVAAVASKKIRVLQVILVASGAVDVRFEDGAGGAALTGVMSLTTNSGFEASFCPVGHFETGDNTLLNLELSAATLVSGWLVYVEV